MTEREVILRRIREALNVQAPSAAGSAQYPFGPAAVRRWLPAAGGTLEEQLALFSANAAELRADFQVLPNPGAFAKTLQALCISEGWKRVATHRGHLTDVACRNLGVPTFYTDVPYEKRVLESCDAGISECDALVAQTGSVLVTSRSAGGRALSVLPQHHVVLAWRSQVVSDLPAAFGLLKRNYAENYPSFISFITGPSRTGDIERILVLGAHGPRKLSILCA